jgi:hypothetical protein
MSIRARWSELPARIPRRQIHDHSHFGESAGTFAQTQFFHEPSVPTQAVPAVCATSAA